MSEIASRPRVRSISATAASSPVVTASALFATAWRSLSTAARAAYSAGTPVPHLASGEISARPVFVRAPVSLPASLPAPEKIKVAALRVLASGNCVVDPDGGWRARLETLQSARTEAEAVEARHALFTALEQSHSNLFARTLSQACVRASAAAGFTRLEETHASPVLRLVASDADGRALVSEIRSNPQGEFDLATEVVGVSDGSCHAILDRFDRALDQQGVRGGPPERRSTGGVCQMPASRDAASRSRRKRLLAGNADAKVRA